MGNGTSNSNFCVFLGGNNCDILCASFQIDPDFYLYLWTEIESMILGFCPLLPLKVKSEGSDFVLWNLTSRLLIFCFINMNNFEQTTNSFNSISVDV